MDIVDVNETEMYANALRYSWLRPVINYTVAYLETGCHNAMFGFVWLSVYDSQFGFWPGGMTFCASVAEELTQTAYAVGRKWEVSLIHKVG
jgi:hypothetical protein